MQPHGNTHNIINEHDQRLKRAQLRQRQSPSSNRPTSSSAAINSTSQQRRNLHVEPALRRAAPVGLSGLRPLPGSARLGRVGKAPPKARDRLRTSGKSKSESSLRRVWHVRHAGLSRRPDDFPLSRGTSRVVSSARADAISDRISDCLRSRSVRARFSRGEDGIDVADCRNADFCKFTISLYAAEDDGVLVEVHRLYGDCISFMRDCRAILNASEGKTGPSPSEEKPLYLRLPASSLPHTTVSPEEKGDGVGIATELLSSRWSDTNILGMESLVFLTDPLWSVGSTAGMASRMILCPDDPGNKPFNVHNYVMSLLIYGDDDDLSPEDPVLASLEDHTSRLRNLAMSALSNALALSAAEDLLATTVAPHREWYANVLIPKLLRDLSTSARRPFDACYASRCLSALARSSTEFADAMKDNGGHEAATSAREVGAREFAMLARDAGSYHNVLISCCN